MEKESLNRLMQTENNYKPLYFLIVIAVLVNFSGLSIPLLDPDAGIYASVARTMAEQNDFVNLYFHDRDWLDKPHFPFWITALSFKLFGVHAWAYKLPGILFVMMGAYYTYLFAKRYYNKTIALWSVIILLTSLHIIISNNDVRAEPYLTGLIIASVYHFSCGIHKNLSWHWAAGCLFAACAVMTKGIFTLVPIAGAIAGHLIVIRNWKQLFHWKWILAVVLIAIFISPELYCLWKQFDIHPEKTVLGNQNVSGIRFFLWDSQFGRFFNTGPITGKGDKLFFIHTLLWAFLPWSLLLYAALFSKLRNGIKKINDGFKEWFTFSGSLLALLLFSFSGFQLPHYTNIIFPMLAIITAHFAWSIAHQGKRIFVVLQNILAWLMVVLAAAVFFFYRPEATYLFLLVVLALLVLFVFLFRIVNLPGFFFPEFRSAVAALIVGVFLNLSFYPDLLKYQAGNQVAAFMNKHHPAEQLGRISMYFPSGEFYMKQHVWQTDIPSLVSKTFNKARMLYVTEAELKQLQQTGVSFNIIKEFRGFAVSMLTFKFLNPASREKELKTEYLLQLR